MYKATPYLNKEKKGRATNMFNILLENIKHENVNDEHFLNAHWTSVNLIQVMSKQSNKQKNI